MSKKTITASDIIEEKGDQTGKDQSQASDGKNNQQIDSQSFEQLKKDFEHPPLITETEKKPEIPAFSNTIDFKNTIDPLEILEMIRKLIRPNCDTCNGCLLNINDDIMVNHIENGINTPFRFPKMIANMICKKNIPKK